MSEKTPGVYVKEIPLFPPSVAQVETAVPVFAGFTQQATRITNNDLSKKPYKISSLLEYETYYGKGPKQDLTVNVDHASGLPVSVTVASPSKYCMYASVRHFYDNGGGECYICSVGDYDDAVSASLFTSNADSALNRIKQIDEITLLVFPDLDLLVDDAEADANDYKASLSTYYSVYAAAMTQCATLQDRFCLLDIKVAPDALGIDSVGEFRDRIGTSDLKYGAAYYPKLKSVYNYDYSESNITFNHKNGAASGNLDGLRLDQVKAFLTAYAADAAQAADELATMVAGVVANVGLTNPLEAATATAAYTALSAIVTNAFEATLKQVIQQEYMILPASPAMAGLYAYTDRTRGVWKAPANVSVNAVVGPILKLNDTQQQDFNVHSTGKSINIIRTFHGRGVLVWGARTLAGNDNEWRYISVRRFFNMVEESVRKASEPFVFEPNDANTWMKVRAMIENFLILQWREGALTGAKPSEAFFVKCGLGETMTSLDILEGRMNVEIGIAAVRPAEFIILKFSHKMQE